MTETNNLINEYTNVDTTQIFTSNNFYVNRNSSNFNSTDIYNIDDIEQYLTAVPKESLSEFTTMMFGDTKNVNNFMDMFGKDGILEAYILLSTNYNGFLIPIVSSEENINVQEIYFTYYWMPLISDVEYKERFAELLVNSLKYDNSYVYLFNSIDDNINNPIVIEGWSMQINTTGHVDSDTEINGLGFRPNCLIVSNTGLIFIRTRHQEESFQESVSRTGYANLDEYRFSSPFQINAKVGPHSNSNEYQLNLTYGLAGTSITTSGNVMNKSTALYYQNYDESIDTITYAIYPSNTINTYLDGHFISQNHTDTPRGLAFYNDREDINKPKPSPKSIPRYVVNGNIILEDLFKLDNETEEYTYIDYIENQEPCIKVMSITSLPDSTIESNFATPSTDGNYTIGYIHKIQKTDGSDYTDNKTDNTKYFTYNDPKFITCLGGEKFSDNLPNCFMNGSQPNTKLTGQYTPGDRTLSKIHQRCLKTMGYNTYNKTYAETKNAGKTDIEAHFAAGIARANVYKKGICDTATFSNVNYAPYLSESETFTDKDYYQYADRFNSVDPATSTAGNGPYLDLNKKSVDDSQGGMGYHKNSNKEYLLPMLRHPYMGDGTKPVKDTPYNRNSWDYARYLFRNYATDDENQVIEKSTYNLSEDDAKLFKKKCRDGINKLNIEDQDVTNHYDYYCVTSDSHMNPSSNYSGGGNYDVRDGRLHCAHTDKKYETDSGVKTNKFVDLWNKWINGEINSFYDNNYSINFNKIDNRTQRFGSTYTDTIKDLDNNDSNFKNNGYTLTDENGKKIVGTPNTTCCFPISYETDYCDQCTQELHLDYNGLYLKKEWNNGMRENFWFVKFNNYYINFNNGVVPDNVDVYGLIKPEHLQENRLFNKPKFKVEKLVNGDKLSIGGRNERLVNKDRNIILTIDVLFCFKLSFSFKSKTTDRAIQQEIANIILKLKQHKHPVSWYNNLPNNRFDIAIDPKLKTNSDIDKSFTYGGVLGKNGAYTFNRYYKAVVKQDKNTYQDTSYSQQFINVPITRNLPPSIIQYFTNDKGFDVTKGYISIDQTNVDGNYNVYYKIKSEYNPVADCQYVNINSTADCDNDTNCKGIIKNKDGSFQKIIGENCIKNISGVDFSNKNFENIYIQRQFNQNNTQPSKDNNGLTNNFNVEDGYFSDNGVINYSNISNVTNEMKKTFRLVYDIDKDYILNTVTDIVTSGEYPQTQEAYNNVTQKLRITTVSEYLDYCIREIEKGANLTIPLSIDLDFKILTSYSLIKDLFSNILNVDLMEILNVILIKRITIATINRKTNTDDNKTSTDGTGNIEQATSSYETREPRTTEGLKNINDNRLDLINRENYKLYLKNYINDFESNLIINNNNRLNNFIKYFINIYNNIYKFNKKKIDVLYIK